LHAEILNVWKNGVDPLIVAHTQPVALKNGVLIVYVDNSVWLNEINSFWKQEILLKLQSAFGEKMIKNIYFTIG
jgi:predicted nucleic acid-binding Zn ribbon protein